MSPRVQVMRLFRCGHLYVRYVVATLLLIGLVSLFHERDSASDDNVVVIQQGRTISDGDPESRQAKSDKSFNFIPPANQRPLGNANDFVLTSPSEDVIERFGQEIAPVKAVGASKHDDSGYLPAESQFAATNYQSGFEPILVAGAQNQVYTNYSQYGDPVVQLDGKMFSYASKQMIGKPYPGLSVYKSYTIARLGLKPLTDVDPLRPENAGFVINNVTAYRYPINVAPCRLQSANDYEGTGRPSLFVAIISAVGNFEDRQLVRRTWLGLMKRLQLFDIVGHAFFVGKHREGNATVQHMLKEESAQYGDIVQEDMIDTYKDLTVKFVGLLNWLHSRCRRVDYVVKVDDDIYVNVRNLAHVVNSISPSVPSIYGLSITWMFIRTPGSKYQVTYEEWPWSTLPVFDIGSCILITGVAIESLLAAAQIMPYFYQDDFYLTALLANEVGVKVYASDSFLDYGAKYPLDRCFVRDTLSWQAKDKVQMEASHLATRRFYDGSVTCRYRMTVGVSPSGQPIKRVVTADPTETVVLSFELVNK